MRSPTTGGKDLLWVSICAAIALGLVSRCTIDGRPSFNPFGICRVEAAIGVFRFRRVYSALGLLFGLLKSFTFFLSELAHSAAPPKSASECDRVVRHALVKDVSLAKRFSLKLKFTEFYSEEGLKIIYVSFSIKVVLRGCWFVIIKSKI